MKKMCSSCRRELGLSEFYKNKKLIDGYHYTCKTCSNEYTEVWRYKIKSLHERGELDVPEQKECFRCKEIKHRSEFYRDRSKVDGLMTYCSKCTGELVKERRKRGELVRRDS